MQSKWESLEETIVSTVSGFLVSLMIQLCFFPIFGITHLSTVQNLLLTSIFTIASILRGYVIRRIYNKRRLRRKTK